jgi:hypothetical protein
MLRIFSILRQAQDDNLSVVVFSRQNTSVSYLLKQFL